MGTGRPSRWVWTGAALLTALLLAACSDAPKCRSRTWRSTLRRPANGPEDRAGGHLRAREVRCGRGYGKDSGSYLWGGFSGGSGGGTRYRFSVFVKRVTPDAPLEVFRSREGEAFESMGTMTLNARGHGKLKLYVPVDESDLFEVRNAGGEVVLSGTAPATTWGTGKAGLLAESRAAGDPEGGARAEVDYLADPSTGRERLNLRFAGLPPRARLDLFLAGEGKDRGPAEPVLTRRASAEGAVRARFDTRDGPGLPRGARRVRDLWNRGFRVQVDGETVWEGVVPAIGSAAEQVPGVGPPGGG